MENNQINFNFEKVYQYDQDRLIKIKDLGKFNIEIVNIDYSTDSPSVDANIKFIIDDNNIVKINDIQGKWAKQYKGQTQINILTFSKYYDQDGYLAFTIIWEDNDFESATGSGVLCSSQEDKPILFSMGPKNMEEIDKVIRKNINSNSSIQDNTILSNPNENCIYNYGDSEVSMRISLNRPNLQKGINNYVAMSIKPNNLFWGEPSNGYELTSTEVTKIHFKLQNTDGNICTIIPYPKNNYSYGFSIGYSVFGFGASISYNLSSYSVYPGRIGEWNYDISSTISKVASNGGASAEGYIYTDNTGKTYLKGWGDITWVEYYWREYSPAQSFYFTANDSTGTLSLDCVN